MATHRKLSPHTLTGDTPVWKLIATAMNPLLSAKYTTANTNNGAISDRRASPGDEGESLKSQADGRGDPQRKRRRGDVEQGLVSGVRLPPVNPQGRDEPVEGDGQGTRLGPEYEHRRKDETLRDRDSCGNAWNLDGQRRAAQRQHGQDQPARIDAASPEFEKGGGDGQQSCGDDHPDITQTLPRHTRM